MARGNPLEICYFVCVFFRIDGEACLVGWALGMLLPMPSSKLVRTERALRVFSETLFSTESGPPPPERITRVVEDAAALLAATTQKTRRLFQLCLFVMMWVAPLFVRRGPGLWSLPLPTRVAALEAMERHPTGAALVLAVKAVLCILYYEQPEAAVQVGADPPCVPGVRKSLPVLVEGVS